MRPILPVGLNTGFWRPIGFANTGFWPCYVLTSLRAYARLLAPYWLCQYGLLAVLCAHFVARIRTAFGALLALPIRAFEALFRSRSIRAFGRAMCSLRCAHTHGFWRPIGLANTGFCIFAILRDFCVRVATRASGMS